MDNISVDVSDGIGVFQGFISNVSRFGIQMNDLPKRINAGTKKMTVVVSGTKSNFKMKVVPRWQAIEDARKSVGAEIINAPWSWTEFVMEHEPVQEKGVWDEIHL